MKSESRLQWKRIAVAGVISFALSSPAWTDTVDQSTMSPGETSAYPGSSISDEFSITMDMDDLYIVCSLPEREGDPVLSGTVWLHLKTHQNVVSVVAHEGRSRRSAILETTADTFSFSVPAFVVRFDSDKAKQRSGSEVTEAVEINRYSGRISVRPDHAQDADSIPSTAQKSEAMETVGTCETADRLGKF